MLSRFKKRSYASVASTRTSDIWPTREALFAYEDALQKEEIVDAILAGNFAVVRAEREFKTPAADGLQFTMSVTPSADPGVLQAPISTKTVQTSLSTSFATPASKCKDRPQSRSDPKELVSVKIEKSDSARVRGARIVKTIFEEVYPHWQALVKMKCEDGCAEKARGYGLERFESGMSRYTPSTIYTHF